MTSTVQITQTGAIWITAAINTNPILTDYSADALAGKIFERRPGVSVVAVVDNIGIVTRTIHRNTAPVGANRRVSGE